MPRCLLRFVCLSESFFKPCLFRLQKEQEKGGPSSKQSFEIPLWLVRDNAVWYRVGGPQRVFPEAFTESGEVLAQGHGWGMTVISMFFCSLTKFVSRFI